MTYATSHTSLWGLVPLLGQHSYAHRRQLARGSNLASIARVMSCPESSPRVEEAPRWPAPELGIFDTYVQCRLSPGGLTSGVAEWEHRHRT